MNPNLNPPDPAPVEGQVFFVPLAYHKSAITHFGVPMLTDPYCQAFIEAMAAILVHLAQRENSHVQEPHQSQRQER